MKLSHLRFLLALRRLKGGGFFSPSLHEILWFPRGVSGATTLIKRNIQLLTQRAGTDINVAHLCAEPAVQRHISAYPLRALNQPVNSANPRRCGYYWAFHAIVSSFTPNCAQRHSTTKGFNLHEIETLKGSSFPTKNLNFKVRNSWSWKIAASRRKSVAVAYSKRSPDKRVPLSRGCCSRVVAWRKHIF